MAIVLLPLDSTPHATVGVTINDTQYILETRWNGRANAWFMNILKDDETPIYCGIRICLGTFLGRKCVHADFPKGTLQAIDLTDQGLDPGVDDLGNRVVVFHFSAGEE